MRQDKILAAGVFVALCVALIVRFGVPEIAIAQPRLLPVRQFPAQIGDWRETATLPISAEVHAKLPTAHIVDRLYSDARGRTVELMLLTATRRDDMHDPARCLPSQGWDILSRSTVHLGAQPVTVMTISQGDTTATAYYWLCGYYQNTNRGAPWQRELEDARVRLLGRKAGMSLFVRLMASDNPGNAGALNDFAKTAAPYIERIKLAALRPHETLDAPGPHRFSRL